MSEYRDEKTWDEAQKQVLSSLTVAEITSMPGVWEIILEEVNNDICEAYEEIMRERGPE